MMSNGGSKHLNNLTKIKIYVTWNTELLLTRKGRISNKQNWGLGEASEALGPGMKFKGAPQSSVIKINDIVVQSLKI